MVNLINDVYQFQTKILKNEMPLKPTYDDVKAIHLANCAQEELDELVTAITERDFPGVVDAVIDTIYFLLGGLHQLGVPAERAWAEVHRANMSKVRGVTKRQVEDDAAKPEDWSPPDHSWVVNG